MAIRIGALDFRLEEAGFDDAALQIVGDDQTLSTAQYQSRQVERRRSEVDGFVSRVRAARSDKSAR